MVVVVNVSVNVDDHAHVYDHVEAATTCLEERTAGFRSRSSEGFGGSEGGLDAEFAEGLGDSGDDAGEAGV